MDGLLSENVALKWVKTYQSAATSAVTSDAVDLAPGSGQAYDGCLFLLRFGTAAADNTAKIQQSSDDAATDAYSDLEGTSVASGTSDEIVFIDVKKPTKRYLKCVLARGTSTVVDSIVAIPYFARQTPVDNTVSGTITGETFVSPAEGTA